MDAVYAIFGGIIVLACLGGAAIFLNKVFSSPEVK
jgi:hypothetical protein